jgi:hypothetical protein
VILTFAAMKPALAGTTLPGQLPTQTGGGANLDWGDFVTNAAGLNTYYAYFIEVPAGTAQLTVEIFDADVTGGGAAAHDFIRGAGADTAASYSLLDPASTPVFTRSTAANGGCGGAAGFGGGCNNTWRLLTTVLAPAAGHWQVRVSMPTGDDTNGYGIRAHDGDPTAGGRELNVYASSYLPLGALAGTTRAYSVFPYVTAGCDADCNDWDSDNTATFTFRSRAGSVIPFTQTIPEPSSSGNALWANNAITGWTDNQRSVGYGIWPSTLSPRAPGAANNFITFYLGRFDTANPPPSAQPEIPSFRLYLPTDGGAAPVKPYLEQLLTYGGAGPNPPLVGQTSRFVVSIRLVNPTPFPITFAAGNLVAASVPGGQVVYAGNPVFSQGALVGQPAVGGSGVVSWNPGVLAAATTALLAYRVNVTPAAPGAIAVTGAPGAGGTTASLRDETGTSLALGPVCALSVNTALATLVTLSSFDAVRENGRVVVQWETASEVGTAGFYLYRYDRSRNEYAQVNDELLPALFDSAPGGTYRLADPGAPPGESLVYALVEVEQSGGRRVYGAYRVDPDGGTTPSGPRLTSGFHRAPREARGALRDFRREARRPRGGRRGPAVKIAVRERGMYFLGSSEIAEKLDAAPAEVAKWIRRGDLALTHRGEAVAWLPVAEQGIVFYGEGIDSIYTRDNVYWLRRGGGRVIERIRGQEPLPGSGFETFGETVHHEQERLAATVIPLDPESDYWFWDGVSAGHATLGRRSFSLQAAGLGTTGGPAALTVNLQGATASGVANEHHVKVRLNGTALGEGRWQGLDRASFTFSFAQSLLFEGANAVEVEGVRDSGVPFSIFYIDSFDLRYQRSYRAAGASLSFRGDSNSAVTVTGFDSSLVGLFDLSDSKAPRLVEGARIEEHDAGFALSFQPASPDRLYLAVAPSGLLAPASVWADQPSRLAEPRNRADYLILTTAELSGAAERLADYRRSQGRRVLVVDLEDVLDEFNHGIATPHAVRDFLAYAHQNWRQGPRYVLLAGSGTLDYRDNLGHGGNLLPPLMVRTSSGLFASDNRLADVLGDDGVPEMAIGRLPVVTAQELDDYIEKLIAFEATAGDGWADRVQMVADVPGQGADFAADSDRAAALLPPSYQVERIYLSDIPIADARRKLIEGINQGVALVNYLGHGGLDRISNQSLLNSGQVGELVNSPRLPLVTGLTCQIGRFEVPGFTSLAGALVTRPGGGAAAVWAPSGLSQHAEARALNRVFFGALLRERLSTLGEAVLRSLHDFAALGGTREMLEIYQLFGDPALELKLPPTRDPSSGTAGKPWKKTAIIE